MYTFPLMNYNFYHNLLELKTQVYSRYDLIKFLYKFNWPKAFWIGNIVLFLLCKGTFELPDVEFGAEKSIIISIDLNDDIFYELAINTESLNTWISATLPNKYTI